MNIQFIPNHNKDGTVIPKKDLKTNPKTLSMIEKILLILLTWPLVIRQSPLRIGLSVAVQMVPDRRKLLFWVVTFWSEWSARASWRDCETKCELFLWLFFFLFFLSFRATYFFPRRVYGLWFYGLWNSPLPVPLKIVSMGAKWRLKCVQTREWGPPSVLVEFFLLFFFFLTCVPKTPEGHVVGIWNFACPLKYYKQLVARTPIGPSGFSLSIWSMHDNLNYFGKRKTA